MTQAHENREVRYEPDENPPLPVALGAALQAAAVIVAPSVLTVVIVARIAEQADSYITWAVFAALLINGVITALQARRLGRVGSGHALIMGTSGTFIAVCAAALERSGPATVASLVVVSSLIQFLMAIRLSWLRRVFTPVVAGTVIMLIAATVMPVVFASLTDVPDGAPRAAAPVAALVTMLLVGGLILRAPPALRLWSPVVGITVGCLVAVPFGLYDARPILEAPWIGAPVASWPGLDLTPGADFWALLPAFVVVTLVGSMETLGAGVTIQRVSRRTPRATDYRVVQGALNADAVGNLLSGIAGTLPTTTYSTSISLAEVTGVASRRVGVIIGAIFMGTAFLPKAAALLISIPPPVAAGYFIVLLGLLFVQGMKVVVHDGVDHRKALVVGVSFWMGAAFQNQWIFPDLLGEGFVGVLFGYGMTGGAIVAIVMTAFMEATGSRRKKLELPLDWDALPRLEGLLREMAARSRWDPALEDRLVLVGEETLSGLLAEEDDSPTGPRRLVVTARSAGDGLELEFICGSGPENLEDRLSYVGDAPEIPDAREMSFRLLRHYASSVRHQKYHDVDIVTVNVAGPR